jgi:hypothetical protein
MVYTPIFGEAAIVEEFKGGWYLHEILAVDVEAGTHPRLGLRLRENEKVLAVHTRPEGIGFQIDDGEGIRDLVLKKSSPNLAIILPPEMGVETAWCGTCNPRLERSSWIARQFSRVKRKVEYVRYRFLD